MNTDAERLMWVRKARYLDALAASTAKQSTILDRADEIGLAAFADDVDALARRCKAAEESYAIGRRLVDELRAALAAATAENETLLRDVDTALAKYGEVSTLTRTPDDVRAQAFETARLALRRVREALASRVPQPDKFPEGDPDEVRPADSRAESQSELNGPSGSPTSPSGRASYVPQPEET